MLNFLFFNKRKSGIIRHVHLFKFNGEKIVSFFVIWIN